jgi:CRP/FNR family transcriptional regulator, anaerobic regulatory protein
MRSSHSKEVDCADCVASLRCWNEPVAPGTGIYVTRARPLAAGEALFVEGAPFDAPYMVTSGCMRLTELLSTGIERIVAFRVPGEIIGLESCTGPTHRYGAHAVNSATVCRMRWSESGVSGRPVAVLRLLLMKASGELGRPAPPWAGLPAVERVREFVEDFRRRTGQPLPMTRAQIGQYLGLAEETVVRAFAQLRRRSSANGEGESAN